MELVASIDVYQSREDSLKWNAFSSYILLIRENISLTETLSNNNETFSIMFFKLKIIGSL